MVRVLHITPDDKFFDEPFSKWESEEGFTNRAVLITKSENFQFKYIKNTDKVTVLSNEKDIVDLFSGNTYDVLFFYSLPVKLWKYFKYIPDDRVLIWWEWGFDLYDKLNGLRPLIPLVLFKKETNAFVNEGRNSLKGWTKIIAKPLRFLLHDRQRRTMVGRIDYLQPVTKLEYPLLQEFKSFRAKEFYYKDSMASKDTIPAVHPANGSILIGNSGTPTNNHLDVLEVVSKYKGDEQAVIVPLNYGDPKYINWLRPRIDGYGATPLYDFLPPDQYFSLVKQCSYCCFGVVRQQAMGNISFCLREGLKVFLYKDSVAYKSLKALGFVVFAIEDIDENSFNTPLTEEEMRQNVEANKREVRRRDDIHDKCMRELLERFRK